MFARRRIESLLLLLAGQALTVFSHCVWEKNDYRAWLLSRPGWIWRANGQLLCLAYTGRLAAKRFRRPGQIQTAADVSTQHQRTRSERLRRHIPAYVAADNACKHEPKKRLEGTCPTLTLWPLVGALPG